MTPDSFEHHWMRRAKWLTQALIISGTLNVGLIATFVTFVIQGNIPSVPFELKPVSNSDLTATAVPMTNSALLRSYSTLPFSDLLIRLEDKELMEEGYTRRDLALACLVAFHHFNLERALGGLVLQQRQISFSCSDGQESVDMTIFPGLADYQYLAIINYARTEKWPFTSQGLFYEIKRGSKDASLLEAFYLTPEFHAVATLFARSGMTVDKARLISLLSEGEWKTLQIFTAQQRVAQDLSPARRRAFILSYLNYRSSIAATLLLESDAEFVCKKLDDAQIIQLLDLIPDKPPVLEVVAKELLASSRSDTIWKRAASILYTLAGEPLPEPYDHRATLLRFIPQKKEPAPIASPASLPATGRTHVVQEGDSLWKIARKYRVSVEAIMKHNKLETEKLRVGKKLDIPDKAAT